MTKQRWKLATAAILVGSAVASNSAQAQSVPLQQVADMLHAVMDADRTVYTQRVVNRLQNIDKVITADEHFQDKKALPLPAQMFRFGAEKTAEKTSAFTYSLLSLWPINKQNAARTPVEKEGLKYVVDNKGKNFYGEETLGGKKFLSAIYADVAISPACVSCHNAHLESPRTDFKLNDVMGAVVIRLPK